MVQMELRTWRVSSVASHCDLYDLRCWSRWAHNLLLFTSAQNKSKANLGWLLTACVIRWLLSFLTLSSPFAIPSSSILPYSLPFFHLRLFMCVYHEDNVTMWKEFCFHHSDTAARNVWEGSVRYEAKVRRPPASSWKWNTSLPWKLSPPLSPCPSHAQPFTWAP